MAKRMNDADIQALLNIRRNLIVDHDRMLDGSTASHIAVVKQTDVAASLTRAIRSLEEVLATAGGVEFSSNR